MKEGKKRKNRKDIDERRRELENKVRTTGRELLDCPKTDRAFEKRHLANENRAVAFEAMLKQLRKRGTYNEMDQPTGR